MAYDLIFGKTGRDWSCGIATVQDETPDLAKPRSNSMKTTTQIALGIFTGALAHHKGRPPILWGIGGFLLPIIALPVLFFSNSKKHGSGT